MLPQRQGRATDNGSIHDCACVATKATSVVAYRTVRRRHSSAVPKLRPTPVMSYLRIESSSVGGKNLV